MFHPFTNNTQRHLARLAPTAAARLGTSGLFISLRIGRIQPSQGATSSPGPHAEGPGDEVGQGEYSMENRHANTYS